jgi:hypothetical protein
MASGNPGAVQIGSGLSSSMLPLSKRLAHDLRRESGHFLRVGASALANARD